MNCPCCQTDAGYWQGHCISCGAERGLYRQPRHWPVLWLSLLFGAACAWLYSVGLLS